jgi:hypothetical protein
MTTIRIEHAGKHFKDLAPKLQKATRRALLSAALRGVGVIVSQIIPSRSPQPVDRGVYRAGWRARSIENGAEILNTEPHAVFIEEGVRGENVKAGRAMFNALLEWVKRKGLGKTKGLAPSYTKLRKTKKGFVPVATMLTPVHDEDANAQFVWAIINSMKRRGIFNRPGPGLGVMRELNEKYLPTIIQEELDREIGAVLG